MKWEQRALRMNNEGKREDSSFGRRRLRKTGLWVVGEKPCRDVCSNDSRRPFVVSTLCSLERLWLQLQISMCGFRNAPHTLTHFIHGIVQFFHPCPVLRRLDLSV